MAAQWQARKIPVPLVLLNKEHGDLIGLVLAHVSALRSGPAGDVVAVFIPEIAVRHWWEQLLHNQVALRLKARLLFQPGVMVLSVPWELHVTAAATRRTANEWYPSPNGHGTLEQPTADGRSEAVSEVGSRS